MQPARDHALPPDPDAWRRADHPRGRVIVIAPTRAACETIELALHAHVETLLGRQHGEELRRWAREGKGFGIVAGTGTGKTLSVRFIAEEILGCPLTIGVVNREREATPETTRCNVVVVTTGIARRWLTDEVITARDTLVVDEIHQTSAELELCLALGKRAHCRFIWLSATVDPSVYRTYLESDEVLVTSAFDPKLAAKFEVSRKSPELFLDDRTVRRFVSEGRGVAVFLPTRAEVERLGADLGERFPRLTAAFYHGGEPIRVVRPFLEGEVKKPWLLAMTAAGQSALNVPGLDTVVILDARYANMVDRGRNVLHRLHLRANELLQMAGRVHGRVAGGQVVILSDREIDVPSLRPGPPEFQLAGDAERVAITCAGIGVDARDLDLPVPLDREAYVQALETLTSRGLVEDGRLTKYGRAVEALPVERPWAELLVHADDDLLPLVAGASGIGSLHRMTRDERDLHGVLVSGSDHLTAYNLLAEAVNACSTLGAVHGLPRHVFDEEALEEWAGRRGVLMKSIEDGALGLAAVYRALDQKLPAKLPQADKQRRAGFVDLVARIQPFDLVIDELTADGQSARISKTSVAGSWGGVAGSLRWFADRMGVARAGIEGTTIPYDLIRQYAVEGPPRVVLAGQGHRQGLALSRELRYFGFGLETALEHLDGPIPAEHLDAARVVMAEALLRGEVDHPSRGRVGQARRQLHEYWLRSGGVLEVASTSALRDLVQGQLGDVTSWDEFKRTPVELDVMAIVSEVERQHLDALPSGVRIHGDMVAFEYVMHGGVPMIRVHLKTGQVRRLQVADLPELDRPLLLTVRRGGASLEATTPDRLRQVLEEYQPPREERDRGGRRRDRDPKGPGRGGRGDRGGKGGSRGKGGPGGGRRRR
ncbi:MAG: DEAD/DEAH box helicase [Gemmatimonadota bacterium]